MDTRWRNFGIIIVIIIIIVLFYFMGPSIILSDNQDSCDVNPILANGGIDVSNLDSYFDLSFIELTALNSKLSECITTDDEGTYHKGVVAYLLTRSEIEASVNLSLTIDLDKYCENISEFQDIVNLIDKRDVVAQVLNSQRFSEYSSFNSKLDLGEDLSDLRESMINIMGSC